MTAEGTLATLLAPQSLLLPAAGRFLSHTLTHRFPHACARRASDGPTRGVTDMGRHVHQLAALASALVMAGCSWSPFQNWAQRPPATQHAAVFVNPLSGTTYRLPPGRTLAAHDMPRLVLATTRDDSWAQAVRAAEAEADAPPRVIAPPRQATAPAEHAAPALAAAAPVTVLQLDREFASITRMVPFALNSATLGPLGGKAVAELVPIAQEAREVAIRGRTDATGSAHTNELLAGARARSVADAFVAAGVPQDKISTSRCIDCFVATNTTRQGRRLNRRVDVELHLPKARIAQLPPPVYALEAPPLILARTLSETEPYKSGRH